VEKMQKSEFLQFRPKGQRPHKPVHRVTNRELFSCFTPQPQQQTSHNWDTGQFCFPEEKEGEKGWKGKGEGEEKEKGLEGELESLFERNNWEQKIEGLFGSEA
jgi:hypothetical protein